MTAAEFYTQKGELKGELRGIEKVAINALKQGFEIESIAKLTQLDITVIKGLKVQVDAGENDK